MEGGTDVEGEVVGEAEGAGEAEALVLGAGGAVADEDGAADDGGAPAAAAGEDLGRLHAVDGRRLGQPDRPHRPRVLRAFGFAAGGVGEFAGPARQKARFDVGLKGFGSGMSHNSNRSRRRRACVCGSCVSTFQPGPRSQTHKPQGCNRLLPFLHAKMQKEVRLGQNGNYKLPFRCLFFLFNTV